MKQLTFLLLFITTSFFAQETITQKIGDFNTLKVYSGLHVQLEKGEENTVIITGKKGEEVIVKNVNGTLKILLNMKGIFNPKQVEIRVVFSEEIIVLDANEGSLISSEEIIKQSNLGVYTQEGATINLLIEVENLNSKAVTGGNIELAGIAINQDMDVTSGGYYNAFELVTENTQGTVSSGGQANVFAAKTFTGKALLGGKIFLKGETEQITKKEYFGGKIKEKE